MAAAGAQTAGCAVSESDVHRWEGTERGPEKLVAVLTHDKYSIQLRTEAAMSLIRMKPRAGKRIGIDQLVSAMASLDEDSRRKIVIGMTPELVKEIEAPPPVRKPDGTMDPDATVPFKDAAFALMSHDPPLVADEKSKTDLTAALIQWTQTDFEDRIDNSAQAYGVEQMMRFFGAPAVKGLPPLMTEQSNKVDRMASLVADLGDAQTKEKASIQLVALAQKIDSPDWIAKEKPLVQEANKRSGANVTEQQLTIQLDKFQEQELVKIFTSMKKIGGRPIIDYCIGFAGNPKNSEERRKAALAALENRVDKNNTADVDHIFAIAKDEATPDSVRDLAFARLGELPKDQIVPKLYTLFESKKWKVRWVAASLVLKTMKTDGLPEFMRHLPASPAQKMGLSEPTTYGALIGKMDGAVKPADAIRPYLSSKELGPKLTALGFYYEGKKADLSVVQSHEDDKTPVPKCDKDDDCGWTCVVPKPGSQETESKTITTVGEFVKFCVEPSMTNK
ncbi:MAG TPA: hypothetical protein VGH28_12435 [Polyangiaceae bacterium]